MSLADSGINDGGTGYRQDMRAYPVLLSVTLNVLNGVRDYAKCDDLFWPGGEFLVSIHNLCQAKGSARFCILGKRLPFA